MFTVTISEKGGEQRRVEFDKSEVTIGRVQGNDIILPKGNVSKRHSRIVLKDGKFIIVDIKSTNGTYVNGRKITSPLVIKPTDKIYIGDFILTVDEGGAGESASTAAGGPDLGSAPPAMTSRKPAAPAPRRDEPMTEADSMPPERPLAPPARPAPAPAAPPAVSRPAPAPAPAAAAPRSALAAFAPSAPAAAPAPAPVAGPPRVSKPATGAMPAAAPARPVPAPAAPVAAPARKPVPAVAPAARPAGGRRSKQNDVLREVALRLASRGALLDGALESAVHEIVQAIAPSGLESEVLVREAVGEATGLGPLDDLLADESVREIQIARPDRILVERGGRIAPHDRGFSSAFAATRAIERLLERAGRRSVSGAVHDLVLDDGTHATIVMPPVAARGPAILLRRPDADKAELDQLTRRGMMSPAHQEVLAGIVSSRRNLLVCGGAGSGRTTLVNALLGGVSHDERVVIVESSGAIEARGDRWVQISLGLGDEARPSLQAALRLRPDRLVLDEVRGVEAFDLLSALSGGHGGAIVVSGGLGVPDALVRLEALARLGTGSPDVAAVRDLLGRSFHVLAQTARDDNGQIVLAGLYEVSGVGADGLDVVPMEVG